MIGETIVRNAAARKGRVGSTFELYSWFFMRVSGAVLAVIAVMHLMYMHFIIPTPDGNGVAHITYDVIVARWTTDPLSTLWRAFDLMLLIFAYTHGSNGIRYLLDDYIHSDGWRTIAKVVLYFTYFIFFALGAYIIFSIEPLAA